MADKLSKEARSRNMAAIRSSATRPERQVIRYLRRAGLHVVANGKYLPGKPDAVIPSAHTVVFVHGCFWHQHGRCADSRLPQSNVQYWTPKLVANKRRDARRARQLRRMGWHVLVIWDCQVTPRRLARLAGNIASLIEQPFQKTTGSKTYGASRAEHIQKRPNLNATQPKAARSSFRPTERYSA